MHFPQCGNLLNDQHTPFPYSLVFVDFPINLCHAYELPEVTVYLLADHWWGCWVLGADP